MNLLNIEYMSMDQFMNTIDLDFKRYSDSDLIDRDTLYKVIAFCNKHCGVRILPYKQCVLNVENEYADLPLHFEKLKNSYIVENYQIATSFPLYDKWTEQVFDQPKQGDPVYTPMGCKTDCNKCYWVVPYKATSNEYIIFQEKHEIDSSSIQIDRENQKFYIPGVSNAKVYISYYENISKQSLIPKHEFLTPWYEWCIKEKILQDILFNSDDPNVVNKLQLVKQERSFAFIDMDNFVKSQSTRQKTQNRIKREQEFENKWTKGIY